MDTVTGDDLDVMHTHLSRKVGENLVTAFETDTILSITQRLNHFTVNVYCCLFCHIFNILI